MNSTEVMTQVTTIFRDVLDSDEITLARTTTADDVDDWDSLNHIQLVVAIEKHFKVKFTSSEIRGWKDVGAMCDAIAAKKA